MRYVRIITHNSQVYAFFEIKILMSVKDENARHICQEERNSSQMQDGIHK